MQRQAEGMRRAEGRKLLRLQGFDHEIMAQRAGHAKNGHPSDIVSLQRIPEKRADNGEGDEAAYPCPEKAGLTTVSTGDVSGHDVINCESCGCPKRQERWGQ